MPSEEFLLHHLERGLQQLKEEGSEMSKELSLRQACGETISPEDSDWLDFAGNLVSEQLVVDNLTTLTENYPTRLSQDEFQAILALNQGHNNYTLKNQAEKKERNNLQNAQKDSRTFSKASLKPSRTSRGKKTVKKYNAKQPTSSSKTYCAATYATKLAVIDWHRAHGSVQKTTLKHFAEVQPELGLKQPLLSKWLSNAESIREKAPINAHKTQRVRTVNHPDIEEMLGRWTEEALGAGLILTGDELRAKWEDFARLKGIPSNEWLSLSSGWLTRFKNRHDLHFFKKHGEAGSVDEATVQEEIKRVRVITDQFKPCDIYNMDETGLFYA